MMNDRSPVTSTKRFMLCSINHPYNFRIWLYRTRYNTYYIKYIVYYDIPNYGNITEKLDAITNKIFDNHDLNSVNIYIEDNAWGYRSYSIAINNNYDIAEEHYNLFLEELEYWGYTIKRYRSFSEAINEMVIDILKT